MPKMKKSRGRARAATRTPTRSKRRPAHLDEQLLQPVPMETTPTNPAGVVPTTTTAAADPGIPDHVAKLIETSIASAIDSIRRELRQPTTNTTPPPDLQVQPTDTAVGALSPASVIVAGPTTLAAPSCSVVTQVHPGNHPANHANGYQPAITAAPPDSTTAAGATHIRDYPTDGGAPHNNNPGNMAAPYVQPVQRAGLNAPPWRPPPRAGPTGKSPAAIPPADLLLPYVDQPTLNALANLGKFIELGDLHPDALAPNSTQATKTQVAFDPDNLGVATFTTEVKRKIIDNFDTWLQCFLVFFSYRTFYYPHLAIPMATYLRFLASKAAAYKPEAWLAYDKFFRLNAARYPDRANWSKPNPDLNFQHFINQPHLLRPSCFACGQHGHLKTDCPNPRSSDTNPFYWENPANKKQYDQPQVVPGLCLNTHRTNAAK